MLHRSFALGLVTALALAGCASDGGLETSATHDPLTRFPAEATFSWDESGNKLPRDERIQALDLDPLIRQAANQEFAARGYRVTASGGADFRLSYHLDVHTWIGAGDSKSVASLSLLLVEASSDRRVWLGYGRAELDVSVSREERSARLRKATAKILEKFPPNQPKS